MTTAQQQIRELKDEVKELAALIDKQAHRLSREAGNGIHLTRAEVRDFAENAGASARKFIQDTRKQASQAAHRYEDSVSAHPWRSTAAALAGGVLLGLLLRRR